MNRKIREIMSAHENGESGFTLIELLVVIIIIGILASIAIPIFMNQQKTARDSATTSDVKNIATNIQSALARYPDATYFAVAEDDGSPPPKINVAYYNARDINGNGKINLFVGHGYGSGSGEDEFETYSVSISKGTSIVIIPRGPGKFWVRGHNQKGKSYTSSTQNVTYKSDDGGIKK